MSFELLSLGSFLLFGIGIIIYGSLDIKMQKVLKYFMKHPTRLEASIQILFSGFPFCIGFIILEKLSEPIPSEICGIFIMTLVIWPFMMFKIHDNLNERSFKLGISSRRNSMFSPTESACVNILGWISSFAFLGIAFIIRYNESVAFLMLPLVGLAFIGFLYIPLFKSISVLRKKDESTEEKKDNQEIS